MHAVNIRVATIADWPAIAAVERVAFASEPYPDFFFRQALELWPDGVLVAESNAQGICGYALTAVSQTPREPWLLSLVVSPALRGAGIGRQLTEAALRVARERGAQVLWLTVAPDNPARHLYLRCGFTERESVADYFGPGATRIRMCCEL